MTERIRRRKRHEIIVIRWRDIPAQVIATTALDKATIILPGRFQDAIDKAAGRGKVTDANSYVAQWDRDVYPLHDADLRQAAKAIADGLEADFDEERLAKLVASSGYEDSRCL
ncbi:MAG: virulence factor [Acidimicrobiales bacterium]|nr:virulence factor [Acidimicrobiales bacterium]